MEPLYVPRTLILPRNQEHFLEDRGSLYGDKDGQLRIITDGGGIVFAIDVKVGKLTGGKSDYENTQ